MVKKLLTFILGLGLAAGASATINFPASNVQYWVGTGSNSAVVIIGWDDNPNGNFALAWGVRWSGSAMAVNMLDTIATYDSRVAYAINSGFVTQIGYNDGTLVSGSSASYWCYTINGGYAGAYGTQPMTNGDVMEISSCCSFSLTSALAATDPNAVPATDPVDATIAFSDILYWVGTGTDSAAFIVNYGQPDTAFAWGYLFNGTTTAQAMLDAIAAADPRFWYVGSPSMGGDIHFILDDGDTLALSPVGALGYNFWWTNLNGVSAGAGIGSTLHNGDVFKYGDLNSAIGWDTLGGYCMEEAWVKQPTPVTPPASPINPTVCDSAYALPYSNTFSNCPEDQNPCEAGAPLPDCWTVLGNGRFTRNTDPTEYIYYSGIGTTTSTNNYGCISPNDPFFSFIAAEIYTGTDSYYINDMLDMGTRKYAILPAFEQPLSQTMLCFDRRTSNTGAALLVGYVMADTSDFVALDTLVADFRVLHHDTVHFNTFSGIPDSARLAFCWKTTRTNSNYVGNIYCGIDNLVVAVDTTSVSPIDTTSPAPVAVDATIDFSDILFWVGEGSNQVVMAVNWADTALAWGYRFDTEQTTSTLLMDAVAAADPRFSYIMGVWGLGDIRYIDTATGMTDTLGIAPGNYWWSLLNGEGAMGMGTPLRNGDLFKWGDLSVAVVIDSTWEEYAGLGYWNYSYVWPYTITPVSVPDTTSTPDPVDPQPGHGPFCGAVGTEGCDAIAADSSAIVAWATGCTLDRGPQNIAVEGSPTVTYPTTGNPAEQAIGSCSMNDNLSVVSLGDGGSATLTFAKPIRNGVGPDFAVYENSFNDTFLELAFVEVSSDGERFVRFPATSLTQTETQATSIDPTYINNLAGKYRTGYGTPFDLEELRDSTGINIDSIVYVRVVDVVGSIDPQYATYDAFGHVVNDPWPTDSYSGGFDLDGVAVIHQAEVQGIDGISMAINGLWPNPTVGKLHVNANRPAEAVLYDFAGRQMAVYNLVSGTNTLDLNALPAGIYMLRAEGSVSKIVKQ